MLYDIAMNNPNTQNMHIISLLILFIFTAKSTSDPKLQHLSISCGSAAASTALNGRQWLPDSFPKFSSAITLQGSSTQSSVQPELTISLDPVPYNTARFSHSQFSYKFLLNSGQKFIRLHFNPTSYKGFQRFNDFFTVEAGPFTLLANFSASLTADALAVTTFVKEFCIIIQDNQPLNIVFTPSISSSKYTYAFVNGIEVISVPSTLDYCHGGDIGVQVVGRKSVIYVDNTTALEMVHRQNIKWASVSSGDDISAMFGMWETIVKAKGNKVNNMTWRISVDVGFRYLVRIHFCELGLRMVETGHKDFSLIINQMIVSTSTDILQERGNESMRWYKNYMVIVEGDKREGKRDIVIYLKSNHVFLDRDGPLEGFEVFKLSNHDNSLSSPNPLPPIQDSPFQTIQIVPSLLGRRNAIATVVFAIICLVNIIVHMLWKSLGASFTEEEEKKPSPRAQRLCRIFSLAEIQSVTDNFHDSCIIGKGGFGKVYKALIDNGQETVAIKRLKPDSNQGKREFWTEVETLSELRHFNLVPLIGYCNEQGEMMLVYEYMSCGTLADHLYKLARKNNAYHLLSWKQRLKICIGAGRGLDYLHTGNGIIHRDIKASNILLDEKFMAKVSDFGLAKIGIGSDSQSQASTNLKGTFGYIDPDYFRTRKLTTKSDVYSFGVVLLEVLCGRQAVEPWVAEERRSLTMWAQDNISKGQVENIVAPALREEVSPDSLKTFVRIAGKCLLDEPEKRPTMARVVLKLEFALEQQVNAESLAPKERGILSDVYPSTDIPQKEKINSLLPNERTNVSDVLPHNDSGPNEITDQFDVMPYTNKKQDGKAKSLSPNEKANTLSGGGRTIISVSTGLTAASPSVKNETSLLRGQNNSNMLNSGMKDDRKSMIQKLSRKIWPWDAPWKTGKPLKKKNLFRHALSAPLQYGTRRMNLSRSTTSEQRIGSNEISSSNLRIFSFSELKAATKNFSCDTVIGSGGFGIVYKGWLKEGSTAKNESGSNLAIKKLNREGFQGFKEWQSEVIFLGKLSHPNLVKLLGYCWTDEELLLVYEFMEKGSLEVPLFTWNSAVKPLPWDVRLNILIGAARGLAFLHASSVIFRDFKPSNILLDESYGAKITDFGLAKSGPVDNHTHVSTQVMGTHGYAAPEYIMTGHLTTMSDVYSFGVVLLEMLTGLRAMDKNRPSRQQSLVVWMKSYLVKTNKLEKVMDPRLEGRYPTKSASEVAQLALKCLESNNKRRPLMQEVVKALERIDSTVEKPLRRPRVHF